MTFLQKRCYTSAQLAALSNLLIRFDLTAAFPEMVFRGRWSGFLFFESQFMFDLGFFKLLKHLLSSDDATSCCMADMHAFRTEREILNNVVFLEELDNSVTLQTLALVGGKEPWLTSMSDFGWAPNTGEWCIYSLRTDMLSVIAFRREDYLRHYSAALKLQSFKTAAAFVERGDFSAADWQNSVRTNYKSQSLHEI
jgi:hypothetical protein